MRYNGKKARVGWKNPQTAVQFGHLVKERGKAGMVERILDNRELLRKFWLG